MRSKPPVRLVSSVSADLLADQRELTINTNKPKSLQDSGCIFFLDSDQLPKTSQTGCNRSSWRKSHTCWLQTNAGFPFWKWAFAAFNRGFHVICSLQWTCFSVLVSSGCPQVLDRPNGMNRWALFLDLQLGLHWFHISFMFLVMFLSFFCIALVLCQVYWSLSSLSRQVWSRAEPVRFDA